MQSLIDAGIGEFAYKFSISSTNCNNFNRYDWSFSGKNLRKNRGNLKEIEKESAGCSFGCLLFCLFMLLWGSCEQQKRFTYLPDAAGALVSESVQEMPKIPNVSCLK